MKTNPEYFLKLKPWNSGWVLAGHELWTLNVQRLTRIDRLEESDGKVLEVRIGNLEVPVSRLPYPTLEPGVTLYVRARPGTTFRFRGVETIE